MKEKLNKTLEVLKKQKNIIINELKKTNDFEKKFNDNNLMKIDTNIEQILSKTNLKDKK